MEDTTKTDMGVSVNSGFQHKQKQYLMFGALSAGVFVILLIIIAFYSSRPKPAFTINGQGYSVSGLNTFITSAKIHNVSKTAAKSQYIAINKDKYVSNELNISISSSDISNAAASQFNINQNKTLDNYEYLTGWDSAFHNQILLIETGGIQGALLVFPFNSLFLNPLPGFPKPTNFGNPSLIAANMQYASQQANYYHTQLAGQKITVATVISKITSDPQLHYGGTGNDSYTFNINNSGTTFLDQQSASTTQPDYVMSAVNTVKGTGVSAVMTQVVDNYTPDAVTGIALSSPQPIAYYFVDIGSRLTARSDISQLLNKDLSSLKVVINA